MAADPSMLRSIVDEARLASKLKDLAGKVLPAQAVVQIDEVPNLSELEIKAQDEEPAKAAAQVGPNGSTPEFKQGSLPPMANTATTHSGSASKAPQLEENPDLKKQLEELRKELKDAQKALEDAKKRPGPLDKELEMLGNQVKNLKMQLLHFCLRQCHQLLIEPLAPVLESEARLIILPDHDLYSLPFCALLDDGGKYLVEKFVVSVAPSVGTVLELELERRAADAQDSDVPATALVVGDPNFHGWLKQLRGAQQEAEEVCGKLLSSGKFGDRIISLVGAQATKEAVVDAMCSSELMHFATHGDDEGVYLSGATVEEGKLSMAEVQGLKLPRAKLVVLSECDSFKGKLTADGVVGITRAFVAAGASTVLATLWKVDDKATKVLMQARQSVLAA